MLVKGSALPIGYGDGQRPPQCDMSVTVALRTSVVICPTENLLHERPTEHIFRFFNVICPQLRKIWLNRLTIVTAVWTGFRSFERGFQPSRVTARQAELKRNLSRWFQKLRQNFSALFRVEPDFVWSYFTEFQHWIAFSIQWRAYSVLKSIADQLGIAILLVHHTRKCRDNDPFNMISGTTGISRCVDIVNPHG